MDGELWDVKSLNWAISPATCTLRGPRELYKLPGRLKYVANMAGALEHARGTIFSRILGVYPDADGPH